MCNFFWKGYFCNGGGGVFEVEGYTNLCLGEGTFAVEEGV